MSQTGSYNVNMDSILGSNISTPRIEQLKQTIKGLYQQRKANKGVNWMQLRIYLVQCTRELKYLRATEYYKSKTCND